MKAFEGRAIIAFVCITSFFVLASASVAFGSNMKTAGAVPATAKTTQARLERQVTTTLKALTHKLRGRFRKEMAAGGPARAVLVCGRLAPLAFDRASRQTGWKITRVGTRVRDPLLGMPDAWEQKVLQRFEQEAAHGENRDKMSYSQIVTEPGGRYFRYMKALFIKPVCLACHGPAKDISPKVMAILKNRYPHDKAIGYKTGQLRGAISVKVPLGQ